MYFRLVSSILLILLLSFPSLGMAGGINAFEEQQKETTEYAESADQIVTRKTEEAVVPQAGGFVVLLSSPATGNVSYITPFIFFSQQCLFLRHRSLLI